MNVLLKLFLSVLRWSLTTMDDAQFWSIINFLTQCQALSELFDQTKYNGISLTTYEMFFENGATHINEHNFQYPQFNKTSTELYLRNASDIDKYASMTTAITDDNGKITRSMGLHKNNTRAYALIYEKENIVRYDYWRPFFLPNETVSITCSENKAVIYHTPTLIPDAENERDFPEREIPQDYIDCFDKIGVDEKRHLIVYKDGEQCKQIDWKMKQWKPQNCERIPIHLEKGGQTKLFSLIYLIVETGCKTTLTNKIIDNTYVRFTHTFPPTTIPPTTIPPTTIPPTENENVTEGVSVGPDVHPSLLPVVFLWFMYTIIC
ncbi:unnamed protein product [Bursaphelenchus xylophilus]|uniref:(pine wood nematode) hypothetical protein n=1 Tax=Bursaphelenchus xylophilus TaxID=6326 RepID=A0A1I7RUH7_BURXY|nr:unnamed protein product [Bursaphelenchus xylophilus]CAG9114135.1 unnamed protein product [Bursaphelenchus xylophilus]